MTTREIELTNDTELTDWVRALGEEPGALREATQAEQNIARAWVARHRWTSPADGELEYAHALKILVFANARPPRQTRPRDHAGRGLPCGVCRGRCSIDGPVVSA